MIRRMAARAPLSLLVAVITGAGLVAGCGGSAGRSHPVAARSGGSPDTAALRVVRGWSGALRRGDLHAAAGYFALPSLFANGVGTGGQLPAVVIRTEREAVAVNASLPCGALVVSASPVGRYLKVVFRLTNRAGPGAGCGSGVGQLAGTDFVVRHGRIVQWIRASISPGAPPPSGPVPPPAQQHTGPQV